MASASSIYADDVHARTVSTLLFVKIDVNANGYLEAWELRRALEILLSLRHCSDGHADHAGVGAAEVSCAHHRCSGGPLARTLPRGLLRRLDLHGRRKDTRSGMDPLEWDEFCRSLFVATGHEQFVAFASSWVAGLGALPTFNAEVGLAPTVRPKQTQRSCPSAFLAPTSQAARATSPCATLLAPQINSAASQPHGYGGYWPAHSLCRPSSRTRSRDDGVCPRLEGCDRGLENAIMADLDGEVAAAADAGFQRLPERVSATPEQGGSSARRGRGDVVIGGGSRCGWFSDNAPGGILALPRRAASCSDQQRPRRLVTSLPSQSRRSISRNGRSRCSGIQTPPQTTSTSPAPRVGDFKAARNFVPVLHDKAMADAASKIREMARQTEIRLLVEKRRQLALKQICRVNAEKERAKREEAAKMIQVVVRTRQTARAQRAAARGVQAHERPRSCKRGKQPSSPKANSNTQIVKTESVKSQKLLPKVPRGIVYPNTTLAELWDLLTRCERGRITTRVSLQEFLSLYERAKNTGLRPGLTSAALETLKVMHVWQPPASAEELSRQQILRLCTMLRSDPGNKLTEKHLRDQVVSVAALAPIERNEAQQDSSSADSATVTLQNFKRLVALICSMMCVDEDIFIAHLCWVQTGFFEMTPEMCRLVVATASINKWVRWRAIDSAKEGVESKRAKKVKKAANQFKKSIVPKTPSSEYDEKEAEHAKALEHAVITLQAFWRGSRERRMVDVMKADADGQQDDDSVEVAPEPKLSPKQLPAGDTSKLQKVDFLRLVYKANIGGADRVSEIAMLKISSVFLHTSRRMKTYLSELEDMRRNFNFSPYLRGDFDVQGTEAIETVYGRTEISIMLQRLYEDTFRSFYNSPLEMVLAMLRESGQEPQSPEGASRRYSWSTENNV
eukprot:TRINITY_DN35037_c0_g1_i1.p1 TRINITY_DN35037_c0_g1~~TRINITY_DN35037_c0_g1_i1.p1  ORF type:complete len:905 (+),score=137.68 TRINITY_DN35037_c0_g1_i1:80-2794(+)